MSDASQITTSLEYGAARKHYWDAQTEFRQVAVAEIRRLMPTGVHTVVLEVNDTPRLTVTGLLVNSGGDLLDDFDASAAYEVLDQIANDMEACTWDEADSFLLRDPSGERFIITREES